MACYDMGCGFCSVLLTFKHVIDGAVINMPDNARQDAGRPGAALCCTAGENGFAHRGR